MSYLNWLYKLCHIDLSSDKAKTVVLLNESFEIIDFSDSISSFFNVLPQDKGRSLLHFTYNFEHKTFLKDLKFVRLTLKPVQKTIQTIEGGVLFFTYKKGIVNEVGQKNICLLFLKMSSEEISNEEFLYDYEDVFENSAFGMAIMKDGSQFVKVNTAFCRLFGYSQEELKLLSVRDITHPDDRNLGIEQRKQYEGVFSLIKRYIRKDGSLFYGRLTVTYLRDNNGDLIASMPCIEDVTDFQESQIALKDSENRFRNLFEYSPIGVVMSSLDGRIIEVNSRFCEMLDYSKDELYQKKIVELSYSSDKKVEGAYAERIRSGEIDNYTIEKRFYKKGGDVIWTNLSISVIRDESQNILHIVGMIADITKQKAAEKALIDSKNHLEEVVKKRTMELKRSNEELSNFAYAASHDMKQPLRTMSSFANLLDKRYGHLLDKRGQEYLHFILDGAQNMSSLITGLLEYAQFSFDKQDHFHQRDLNVILKVVQQNLRKQISEHQVQIVINDLPEDANIITPKMIQLIQNLISNAIKFRKKEMPCIVEISNKDLGTQHQLSIKDNGIGIPVAYQGEIFEIFKKLHNTSDYQGNGIGLATCQKIVHQHEGKIWVESKEGEGAVFHFTIQK